jgi:hypothetical protein
MADQNQEIAKYKAGTAKVDDLKTDVAAAWKDILSKPEKRTEAAKALGVDPAELGKLQRPPVDLSPGSSNFAGGEVVIGIAAWLGTEVALGAFKDLAKEELKKRVKKLWLDVLEPAVRGRLKDFYGLGSRADES